MLRAKRESQNITLPVSANMTSANVTQEFSRPECNKLICYE